MQLGRAGFSRRDRISKVSEEQLKRDELHHSVKNPTALQLGFETSWRSMTATYSLRTSPISTPTESLRLSNSVGFKESAHWQEGASKSSVASLSSLLWRYGHLPSSIKIARSCTRS